MMIIVIINTWQEGAGAAGPVGGGADAPSLPRALYLRKIMIIMIILLTRSRASWRTARQRRPFCGDRVELGQETIDVARYELMDLETGNFAGVYETGGGAARRRRARLPSSRQTFLDAALGPGSKPRPVASAGSPILRALQPAAAPPAKRPRSRRAIDQARLHSSATPCPPSSGRKGGSLALVRRHRSAPPQGSLTPDRCPRG
jgi:hypothetical protein